MNMLDGLRRTGIKCGSQMRQNSNCSAQKVANGIEEGQASAKSFWTKMKQTVSHSGENIQVWVCITPEGMVDCIMCNINMVQYCDIGGQL